MPSSQDLKLDTTDLQVVLIKDWKLIYSELFILKRKNMENWGGGGGQLT
jgi:hypothetical protein